MTAQLGKQRERMMRIGYEGGGTVRITFNGALRMRILNGLAWLMRIRTMAVHRGGRNHEAI